MKVNFKKLSDLAKIPTRGSEYAAGYDLYAATDKPLMIHPHETIKVPTDLAMEIPAGTFGAIFARSGLASKHGLRPANCVGVVDSDYRGNIIVMLHNDTNAEQVIMSQERIAQLIIVPYCYFIEGFEEIEELSDTVRGEGGFGSTGRV